MELLVATWTLRFALIGAAAVGGLTMSAGGSPVDAVDRAALAAFAFTFLGRQLIGWLETPEQRMLRLRSRRARSAKGSTDASADGSSRSPAATGGGSPNGNGSPAADTKARSTTSSTKRSRAA